MHLLPRWQLLPERLPGPSSLQQRVLFSRRRSGVHPHPRRQLEHGHHRRAEFVPSRPLQRWRRSGGQLQRRMHGLRAGLCLHGHGE